MITVEPLRRAALFAGVTAFLATTSATRVEAQVGIGFANPGVPFLYFNTRSVPSPTDYLYDHANARIALAASAAQQEAAASRIAETRSRQNSYFNRIRDFSGDSTYQVNSRQSVSRRTSARKPRETPAAAAPASPPERVTLSLDAYFLANGALDWPHDAPDSAELRPAREEAERAVRVVLDEVRAAGKAKAQSVGAAKHKLVSYGQRALAEVRSARAEALGHVFHYYLLFLHDSLDVAAGLDAP
jgi:hypothetical protein